MVHTYGRTPSLVIAKVLRMIFPPGTMPEKPLDGRYATVCLDDYLSMPEKGIVSFVPAERIDESLIEAMKRWPGRVAAHGLNHKPFDSPVETSMEFFRRTGFIPLAYAQPYGMLNRFLLREALRKFMFVRLPGKGVNVNGLTRTPLDTSYDALRRYGVPEEEGWIVVVTHGEDEALNSISLLKRGGYEIVDFLDMLRML